MFAGSTCINVNKNSHGYLVLHDPSGGLLNRSADSVTEDNGKVTFQVKSSKVDSSGMRMIILVKGNLDVKAPASPRSKTFDDGSCPDGGNVSVTLNGDMQPTAIFYATYTNDPTNP
jgi:hypothetical protein